MHEGVSRNAAIPMEFMASLCHFVRNLCYIRQMICFDRRHQQLLRHLQRYLCFLASDECVLCILTCFGFFEQLQNVGRGFHEFLSDEGAAQLTGCDTPQHRYAHTISIDRTFNKRRSGNHGGREVEENSVCVPYF